GILSTFAGTTAGYNGDGGPATQAMLSGPIDVAIDGAGNVFVADQSNHAIRRIDAVTGFITTIAGNPSFSCGQVRDGQAATSAGLCALTGVASDPNGGAPYIADQSFHRVRRVDPGADGLITGAPDELISTVAGNGSCSFSGDNGPATSATMCNPTGVAF